MKNKIICFDLWQTLIYSGGQGRASYENMLTELGVARDKIYPYVRDNLMSQQLTYREMVAALLKYFDLKSSDSLIKRLKSAWVTDNGQVAWFDEAIAVLRNLKQEQAKLVLVTNTTLPGWLAVESKLKVSQYFDHLFLSWQEGISKPNQIVWRRVQSWFPDTQPENFLMIGDNQDDDLAMPKKMGWNVKLVNKDGNNLTEIVER